MEAAHDPERVGYVPEPPMSEEELLAKRREYWEKARSIGQGMLEAAEAQLKLFETD